MIGITQELPDETGCLIPGTTKVKVTTIDPANPPYFHVETVQIGHHEVLVPPDEERVDNGVQ